MIVSVLRSLISYTAKKKVREKSRECQNHKPQPFPDHKRKRKPTDLNKHKPNKRTKSTKIISQTLLRQRKTTLFYPNPQAIIRSYGSACMGIQPIMFDSFPNSVTARRWVNPQT